MTNTGLAVALLITGACFCPVGLHAIARRYIVIAAMFWTLGAVCLAAGGVLLLGGGTALLVLACVLAALAAFALLCFLDWWPYRHDLAYQRSDRENRPGSAAYAEVPVRGESGSGWIPRP